jgi:hypothetical protein
LTEILTDNKQSSESHDALLVISSLLRASPNEAAMALLREPGVVIEPSVKLFNRLRDQDQENKGVITLLLSSFSLMAEASVAASHHMCESKVLESIAHLSLSSPQLTRDCLMTLTSFAGRPDQETRGKVKEACEEAEMIAQLCGILGDSSNALTDISITNCSIILLWTLCTGDDYKKQKLLEQLDGGHVPRSLALILDSLLSSAPGTAPTRLLENTLGLTSCLLSLLKSEWSKRDQCYKMLSLPLTPEDDMPQSIASSLAQSSIRSVELNLGGLHLLSNLTLHEHGVNVVIKTGVLSLLEGSALEKLLIKSPQSAAALVANLTRHSSKEQLIDLDCHSALILLGRAAVRLSPTPQHPSSSSLSQLYALCSAIESTSKLAPPSSTPHAAISDAALLISGHLLLVLGRPGASPLPLEESTGRAVLAALSQLLISGHIHPELPGLTEKILTLLPPLLEGTICREGGGEKATSSLLLLTLLQELARSRRVASALISDSVITKLLLRGRKEMKDQVDVLLIKLKPVDRYHVLKRIPLTAEEEDDIYVEDEEDQGSHPPSVPLLEAEEVEFPMDIDEDEDGPQSRAEEIEGE